MTQLPSHRKARARELFAKFHAGEAVEDRLLDDVLGLDRNRIEDQFTLLGLVMTHGHHRLEAGDMPYSVIRDLYRALALPPGTRVADLGCGYGRIGFYGALLWEHSLHGIEIVPERVAEARRLQQELGLDTLRFDVGDVTTAPWPHVSHYLLMNSVFPSLMPAMVARLRDVAEDRLITLVSVSSANELLREQSWLQEHVPECPSAQLPVAMRVFRSRLAR